MAGTWPFTPRPTQPHAPLHVPQEAETTPALCGLGGMEPGCRDVAHPLGPRGLSAVGFQPRVASALGMVHDWRVVYGFRE